MPSQCLHFNNANFHDSVPEKTLLVRTEGFITTMLAELGLLQELSEKLSEFSFFKKPVIIESSIHN